MIFSPDPRFWLAIARDVVRAARGRTPNLHKRDVSCPCGCGLKLGERWEVK